MINAVFGFRVGAFTAGQEVLCQPDVIKRIMLEVADYQVAEFGDELRTDWKAGTFYSGVFAAYQATGHVRFYEQARAWCETAQWQLPEHHFFADDICTAQTFLDIYLKDREPRMIEDVVSALGKYFGKETVSRRELGWPVWEGASRPFIGRNVWWWCDALYMAPPVLTRIHAATGDPRYLELLHAFYWDSVAFLFNEEAGLFFRDARFFQDKTPSGDPVIWSRGNGWVYAGLIRLLDYLPESDPMRHRYIELFQTMTRSIVGLQGDDGMWRSSLNDPSWKPMKESSGTSFFCYGLLAGIRRGYLDERSYLPVALKAWEGLLGCINDDGRLGFAQLVSGEPGLVRPNDSVDYAHGAFLLAASELYRMNLQAEDFDRMKNPQEIKLLSRDGAWTWFNDERVVYDGNGLFIGSNDSEGFTRLDYYSIVTAQSPYAYQRFQLSSWREQDDHNNPALLFLGEKHLLAAYTRHHFEDRWYLRTARLGGRPAFRALHWGEEIAVEAPAKVTYSNLVRLADEEDTIYNFMRCVGWNPTVVISRDNAQSWSDPIELIRSGNERTRPYVKYADNGKDRIDMVFTQAHPRQENDNNIYHIYYKKGLFHRSDGTPIRSLAAVKKQPLVPEDGTLVYSGSEAGRGWVWDLEYDAQGHPVIAFINAADHKHGTDLRYRLATWNDAEKSWTQAQVAFAGRHLYAAERHYAGGLTIDPENTDRIYLSANVDPRTGAANETGRYQIYRGMRTPSGWQFEQLTFDAQVDNIRPVVPRLHGDREMVVWVRGQYRTYTDYDTEIVGIIGDSADD